MSKKDKKYEFNEVFIEKNIANLCKEYDLIHGASINIARITPDYIDGLKPVQRRALYAMFLKDGGKKFRKLASISGSTFGLFHPHCLTGDTYFVLSNGSTEALGTLEPLFHPVDNMVPMISNKLDRDNIQVLSFDYNTKNYKWSKLVDVRITKYVKQVYVLHTTNGKIGCTEDHQFLVVKNIADSDYTWEWKECKDLVEGDILCSSLGEIGELDQHTTVGAFRLNDNEYLHYNIDEILGEGISVVDHIEIVDSQNEVPMYDFTVQDTECAFVYTGERYGSTWNKAILAHNSPTSIDDAIVNMEQPWRNTLPLVDGAGNYGNCNDAETEVLTREGWKLFKDITYDDKLASVDPNTRTMIFEHPTNIIAYEYEGPLICCDNKSTNFAVTPDHNMVVQSQFKRKGKMIFSDEFKFIKAKDLGSYSRFCNEYYYRNINSPNEVVISAYISKNGVELSPELIIPMDIWVQFIGIYLADGFMYDGSANKYSHKIVHLSVATKERKKKYFKEILDAMGLTNVVWKDYARGFIINNAQIYDKLASYGLEGKYAREKFVPDFIFDLDYTLIKKFLYGFAMGDGSFDVEWPGAVSYWTGSIRLATQIQILLLMSGKYSTLYSLESKRSNYYKGKLIDGSKPQYQVYQWVSKNQSFDTRVYGHTETYKGMVYCAEVPTYHTLITRRNGKILLSGNCSGDEAGASRYIQARLSDYARACFFDDWKDAVVDMKLSYNEENEEPLYLPAKYPNVLLNGCIGLGYGLATNVFATNFKELVDATIKLIKDPNANVIIIPDSPTGCDIVETDFNKINRDGVGTYKMRCTYEIDDESNIIKITSLPVNVSSSSITSKIADIKEKGGMPELVNMADLSGVSIDIQLHIRDDVNPYKFMRKLIKDIPGLEKSYPVNITVVKDMEVYDFSPKQLLLEWIEWRREQKRTVITHKRSRLLAEQRTNDVKIFVMNSNNLEDTIRIVRTHNNRADIEKALIERYHDSPIHMDSLQARVLSGMRLYEFSVDERERCIQRREELEKELVEVEEILNSENGIDKIIISELKDGVKRFGKPRNSSLVPEKISVKSIAEGECILQLSSDGNLKRRMATNIDVAIPEDINGFAVKVDNDAAFIIIDNRGYLSFIKAADIPLDVTVPVSRYANGKANNNIIAMLPYDIDSTVCVTLVSSKGIIKRMRIAELGNTKKPCIHLDKDDKLVRGVPTYDHSQLDLLVYTKDGYGQRLNPNSIRITSPMAKGNSGFKLNKDDEIIGVYTINPIENLYILYVTNKGKMRLNALEYLPARDNKNDRMVKLIPLAGRDKLISVIGCNKLDIIRVFYDNGGKEEIKLSKLPESTMSAEPKKVTEKQNAVTTNIVKVELK